MTVLGIIERAQWKTAYKRLILTAHPDKGGYTSEFIIIQEAGKYFKAQTLWKPWKVFFKARRKEYKDFASHKKWVKKNIKKNMEEDTNVEVITAHGPAVRAADEARAAQAVTVDVEIITAHGPAVRAANEARAD